MPKQSPHPYTAIEFTFGPDLLPEKVGRWSVLNGLIVTDMTVKPSWLVRTFCHVFLASRWTDA